MPAGFAAVRALRVSGTALAVLEGFEAQRPSGRRFVLPKQQLDLGCLGDILNLDVTMGESAQSLPIYYLLNFRDFHCYVRLPDGNGKLYIYIYMHGTNSHRAG